MGNLIAGNRMTFNEYQGQARKTAIYRKGDIAYLALGLNGEAGEVAEIVKRTLREHEGQLSAKAREHLLLELGDCLWYLSNFCSELGIPLSDIAAANLSKLQDRQTRGVLHGNGDDR